MVTSADFPITQIEYPDEDGQPMAEGDTQRKYLTYCTEALSIYFKSRSDIYVAGNLFIYYEEGNPATVVAPDVFVVMGVSSEHRRSYKTWESAGNYLPLSLTTTAEGTLSIRSTVLKLDLQVHEGALRFYTPEIPQKLLAHDELDQALQQSEQSRQVAEQALQQSEQARQAAEQRANQEVAAWQTIETRLAELEAQIKALQPGSSFQGKHPE